MSLYDGKSFRVVATRGHSQTTGETIFHYKQCNTVLTGIYSGGNVNYGHLIGRVDDAGCIDMRYHHLNGLDELMTGICRSKPEILKNGKIRLHEQWQWTCGSRTKGTSILEEL